ncbi:MAG: ABC transporter permease, partial [Acidimicrobiia bacterium]
MSHTLTIASHHLRRMVKNPGLVLLLMAIPTTLALIEYAAFGPSAASGKLPPIKVLFLDEDGTFASRSVPQFFAGGPMKDYFELANVDSRQSARRPFERNQASALIVVPKGFQDALLDGRKAVIELYKNPIQTFSPAITESVLEMAVALANGLYIQAHEPIAQIRKFVDTQQDPSEEDIAEISRGFFRAGERFARLGALQDMSVELQRPAADSGAMTSTKGFSPPKAGDFFGYIFPGLALFGLMFISQALSLRLLRDRARGLQRRLLATPATRSSLLAGGMLYLIAASLVVLALLGILGGLVFRIRFREPAALLVIGLGFAVFTAGLHLTTTGLARSDRG